LIVINASFALILKSIIWKNGLTSVIEIGLHVFIRFFIGDTVIIVICCIVILGIAAVIIPLLIAFTIVVVLAFINSFSYVCFEFPPKISFRREFELAIVDRGKRHVVGVKTIS
jgi:hypothetical protein